METKERVIVTGIDIPFGDLVVTLIKLAIAMIPATIIVAVAGSIAWAMLAAVLFASGGK